MRFDSIAGAFLSDPSWPASDSSWDPGDSGVLGSSTQSPRLSACVRPSSVSPSETTTTAFGAARPATTISPAGLTRTTSNRGTIGAAAAFAARWIFPSGSPAESGGWVRLARAVADPAFDAGLAGFQIEVRPDGRCLNGSTTRATVRASFSAAAEARRVGFPGTASVVPANFSGAAAAVSADFPGTAAAVRAGLSGAAAAVWVEFSGAAAVVRASAPACWRATFAASSGVGAPGLGSSSVVGCLRTGGAGDRIGTSLPDRAVRSVSPSPDGVSPRKVMPSAATMIAAPRAPMKASLFNVLPGPPKTLPEASLVRPNARCNRSRRRGDYFLGTIRFSIGVRARR